MFRHVVLFTWTPDTTDADIDAITAALGRLPAAIPDIRRYDVGRDVVGGGNADYAIVADFDDLAGFEAYRDHPEHVAVATTSIRPRIATRTAVQYEIVEPEAR